MKPSHPRFRFFMCLGSFLASMSCGSPQIIIDTAKLDQAYIPLLFLTGQSETTQPEAIQLFDRFIRRWHLYYGHYQAANQINPEWGQGLDKVNITIRSVEDSLVANASLPTIHKMLESVRVDLMNLRQKNQIGYALDELTAFHELMEPMVTAATQMEIDSTKAEQYIAPILNHLEAAQKQWLRVQMVRFDPVLYNLNEDDLQVLKDEISEIKKLLETLDLYVNTHDTIQIATTTRSLKPIFVKLYLLFGDFNETKQKI